MAATPAPKRTMDDSDIGRLEDELKEEQRKCHAAADEAIPLAESLQRKLEESGRVRIKTPPNGFKVRSGKPERTPPPSSSVATADDELDGP